jgi:hypothetical protein
MNTYSKEFREEALGIITEQGYSVPRAADAPGVLSWYSESSHSIGSGIIFLRANVSVFTSIDINLKLVLGQRRVSRWPSE